MDLIICWNVGLNLAKQITLPKTDVSIFYYLGKELDKSMFLSPVDDQDIIITVNILRAKCQQIAMI